MGCWFGGEEQLVSKENDSNFYGAAVGGAGMTQVDFSIYGVPVASLLVAMVGVGFGVGRGIGTFTWEK